MLSFLLGFTGVYHRSIPYSGLLCRQTWITKFPRNSPWNSRTSRIYFNTDIYTSVHVWIYHCIHDSYRRSARKRYVNKGPYWSLWMQMISLTCCGISKFMTWYDFTGYPANIKKRNLAEKAKSWPFLSKIGQKSDWVISFSKLGNLEFLLCCLRIIGLLIPSPSQEN